MLKISNKIKNLLSLTGITLSCLAPIIAAQIYFYYGNPKKATINKGELLNPVLNINDLNMITDISVYNNEKYNPKKWHIIYVSDNSYCNKNCEKIIYNLQQVVISFGKNTNRTQRLLLISDKYYNTDFNKSNWNEIFTKYQHLTPVAYNYNKLNKLNSQNIYISDPNGNIILAYKLNNSNYSNNIASDLKKLLNLSKIG